MSAESREQQKQERQKQKRRLDQQAEEEDAGGSAQKKQKAPSAATLPWMRVPISIQPGAGQPIDQVPGMDARLQRALSRGTAPPTSAASTAPTGAIRELFPVQAVVWTETGGGLRTEHDLCIAAPTGSGKTLAYALPVINALAAQQQQQQHEGSVRASTAAAGRRRALRALVVLPTGDLAEQVASVMRPLCQAVGLNLQLAAARVSVAAEADAIMHGGGGATTARRHGSSGSVAVGGVEPLTAHWLAAPQLQGEGGATDVLVATPGRLMTHLASTRGFTLRHLRFLVVDETDRLLRQSYQEWLPHVTALLHGPQHDAQAWHAAHAAAVAAGGGGGGGGAGGALATPQAARARAPHLPRCVKLVVSATLTRDPAKVQRLRLHCPRFVAVTSSTAAPVNTAAAGGAAAPVAAAGPHRYQLPKSLKEYKVLCSAARKPITLLALLKQLEGKGQCVVFASSLDTTHRLYLLLRTVLDGGGGDGAKGGKAPQPTVVECSGHKAAAAQRAEALRLFKAGTARILVASDVVTRGMDFEGGVSVVINYDAPVYAKTYVHRAGRTARAGREGSVFTLLRDEDVRHFKAMLRKADNSYVADYKLPAGAADAMAGSLSTALQEVAALLAAEQQEDEAKRKRAP